MGADFRAAVLADAAAVVFPVEEEALVAEAVSAEAEAAEDGEKINCLPNRRFGRQ